MAAYPKFFGSGSPFTFCLGQPGLSTRKTHLSRAECAKVGCRLGDPVIVELDLDAAFLAAVDMDIEKAIAACQRERLGIKSYGIAVPVDVVILA